MIHVSYGWIHDTVSQWVSLTQLSMVICSNPEIHEGFSESSSYYIFMIMSQWWRHSTPFLSIQMYHNLTWLHSWCLSPITQLTAPGLHFVFVFLMSQNNFSLGFYQRGNSRFLRGKWSKCKQIRSFSRIISGLARDLSPVMRAKTSFSVIWGQTGASCPPWETFFSTTSSHW